MTIKLNITQTCDACGVSRELQASPGLGKNSVCHESPQIGGWRKVGDKDVCPGCLNKLFKH